MALHGELREREALRRNLRLWFPGWEHTLYLRRRSEEKRIVASQFGGDCEIRPQHRMQPPRQLTRSTVRNRGLAAGDDAVRNLVLPSKLRRQGGITKPTFSSRLPVSTRRQGKETRSQKYHGMTNAHGSYLKIKPWPNISVSLLVLRKEPLSVIELYAPGARTFSVPTITPRSPCILTRWPIT